MVKENKSINLTYFTDLRQLGSQAQKRPANYLAKLLKEFPQEYFQADDEGDSRFKCALGIGRFNGGIYGKQKASEQDKYREIEIEDLSTPEEDEEVQKMNGNGYRTVMPNTDIDENRREIDSKKEQDITGKFEVFFLIFRKSENFYQTYLKFQRLGNEICILLLKWIHATKPNLAKRKETEV